MSLNTAHVAGQGVLIFNTERILIYYDGVEMAFDMSCNLPHFKGKKHGRVYLTTHRVIFNSKDAKDTLQSFSMPFYTMKELELEQPVFGANYIKGKVKAEQNGNWEGDGKFKMWFNKGGAIEFGQAMLHAGKLASRYMPPQPPAYSPPMAGYYQAPPPAYAPPTGQMYGFVPYQTFPTAPPANSVYMYEAPPPYPGIDPNLAPYPIHGDAAMGGQAPPFTTNGHPPGSAAAAKEAEAMAGANAPAYYNPSAPHNVYMPPAYGPPSTDTNASAPPPYSEAAKKND